MRQNRGASQVDLIRQLNPVIRGWVNYHRHIVAWQTFKKVEMGFVADPLAMGQTQTSGQVAPLDRQQILASAGRRAWQFAADTGERTPAGKPVWLRLVNPTETKIRRHVKVRADANPFDPHWHDYFEDRAFFKKFGIHRQEAGIETVK